MSNIDQLLDVMRKLRDPETGCAWDIKQTFETIAPYTIEEAYEVADAIARNDLHDLKDELGDLLLQVVFHAQMADDQGQFQFADVVESIVDKMVRRHPHVFGNEKNNDPESLKTAWEAQKADERAAKKKNAAANANSASAAVVSALDDVAIALPALMRAEKIQKRAARVGFDWPEITPVWDKLDEEVAEVKEAIAEQDSVSIEDEIGDLIFTVVNLARHTGIDPEVALRNANNKFEHRFRRVEQLAHERQLEMQTMDLSSLDDLWELAKAER